MENWLIGTDYEFGISRNGEPISIVGKIGGTKHKPLSIGNGCARQEDNVNAEVTQPPVYNFEDFIGYIEYGLTTLKDMLPNYDLMFNSMSIYSDKELDTPEARLFGCESSMNVYKRGQGESTECDNPNLRSAGFHIHFGNESIKTTSEAERFVKLFDKYVTLPSVLIDPERGRRKLYGRTGEFRFKPYGLECRQLGAYFLSNSELIEWVWDRVQQCISQFELGENLNTDMMFIREDRNELAPIEDIINNYDLDAIKLYCDENNINYLNKKECKTSLYMEA